MRTLVISSFRYHLEYCLQLNHFCRSVRWGITEAFFSVIIYKAELETKTVDEAIYLFLRDLIDTLRVNLKNELMMEVENPVGSMNNEQYRQMNGDEKSEYLDDEVNNDEAKSGHDNRNNKAEGDDKVESDKSDDSVRKEGAPNKEIRAKKERTSRTKSRSTSSRRRHRRRRHSSSSSTHTASTKSRSRSRSRSRTKSHSRSRSPRRASSRSRSRSRRKSSKKKTRRSSRSYSRSQSPMHHRKASRSRSPRRRPTRSSSSSSRDTYGSFKALSVVLTTTGKVKLWTDHQL
ncbi:hypothetical protein X798_06771 [Onchocerca flexuosa]|uniref:Uncharacterized protein n=1 Tax=Onchocerca flexuosa TaxID=387005 RepID=A0A238BLA8_9BILA|nr:hypothetical protein X798_06771 [Onchocerca flexuosa]